MKVRNWRAD